MLPKASPHFRRKSFWKLPLHVLARELHYNPLRTLATMTGGMLLAGALAIYLSERLHHSPLGFWESLWLAAVSSTTSEPYGIQPTWGLSRFFAVVICFLGVTLSGAFIAALTSLVINAPEPEWEKLEHQSLCARLDRIEKALERMEEKR